MTGFFFHFQPIMLANRHRGSAGRFVVKAPLVLGHESSGIVVAVGSDVTQLAVGTLTCALNESNCGQFKTV